MSDTNITRIFTSNQAGSAQKDYGRKLVPLLTSLSVSLGVCFLQIALFSLIRKKYKFIYEPRTFRVPIRMQIDPSLSGTGPLGWFLPTFRYSLDELHQSSGADAYFFLRYLLLCACVFSACSIIILPILAGVNSTGSFASGLDSLSWSNISASPSKLHVTHLILCIALSGGLCVVLHRELSFYVKRRCSSLVSPSHISRASSSTILVRNIPSVDTAEAPTTLYLKQLFDSFPGGVRRVWINRDYKELIKLQAQRDEVFDRLERVLTLIVVKAGARERLNKKTQKEAVNDNSRGSPVENYLQVEKVQPAPGMELKKYLNASQMPKHYLPMFAGIKIPLISPRVDSLSWCKSELERLNNEIETRQNDPSQFPLEPSCAFIQFNSQAAAHMACQTTVFATPSKIINPDQTIEVNPNGVVWKNLHIVPPLYVGRVGLFFLCNALIMIGWAFPVGVLGFVSQLYYISQLIPLLHWINKLPVQLILILSGILPSLFLSLLLSIVPTLFKSLAVLKGNPTVVDVQRHLQWSMFIFLFIQVFLVITVSNGIPAVMYQIIKYPTSLPRLLANNLPRASNFFFSYISIQSLSTSGNLFLQICPLVIYNLLRWASFLSRLGIIDTVRSKFKRFIDYPVMEWGTIYPVYTNLAVISIIYTTISPLMVLFSSLAFLLLFFSYKYRIMFGSVTKHESYGLYYPTAIFQLFVGIYCMQICLMGLFAIHTADKSTRIIYTAIMSFAIFITGLYNYHLYFQFKPLLKYLPISFQQQESTSGQRQCNNPTSDSIFDGIETEFKNLTSEQQDHLIEQSYFHLAIRTKRPCIWIPRDNLGISEDQINDIRLNYTHINISCEDTYLLDDGSIHFTSTPPDYDPSLEMAL